MLRKLSSGVVVANAVCCYFHILFIFFFLFLFLPLLCFVSSRLVLYLVFITVKYPQIVYEIYIWFEKNKKKRKKVSRVQKTIDVMSIFNLFSSRQNFKQARKKRRFPHINILFWLVMRVGEMKKITATITTVSFCLLHTSGSATQKHSSPNSKQATLHIQNTNTLTHVSISLSHSLCLSKCA